MDGKTLPEGVNVVAVFPTLAARDAVIEVIGKIRGIWPATKSDSVSAQRAHYPEARTKLIINTASAEMQRLLGPHSLVLALTVPDRVAAAKEAMFLLSERGFEVRIYTHPEPEFQDGFITFVTVKDGFGAIALMFWPTDEYVQSLPIEVRASLPAREPWLPHGGGVSD